MIITDLEIADIQPQWTFFSILARASGESYTSRVYTPIPTDDDYSLAELNNFDLYKPGGEIVTSAGLEVIQYDNQYLSYHIETKDNKYYLVACELLLTYTENKASLTAITNGGVEGIEIQQVDKISTVMGGQAIAYLDK